MMRHRGQWGLLALLILAAGDARLLAGDKAWYVDDEKFSNDFFSKLTDLAKQGKCLRSKDINRHPGNGNFTATLAASTHKRLTAGSVYRRALKSVFIIGSVAESGPGKGNEGGMGTAWVLAEDGVLVTNWHLFEKSENECFGVANRKGEVFPVTEVLASDQVADIAVIRVAAKSLTPLPLAGDEPVGGWVGVLSHPGGQLFSFTQGYVTRYTKNVEDGKEERWMCISADYAVGSSGAPVLNRYGEVAGMASSTANIDADIPSAEKPEGSGKAPESGKEKPPKEAGGNKNHDAQPSKVDNDDEGKPSRVQMVVKLAVPGSAIRALSAKGTHTADRRGRT